MNGKCNIEGCPAPDLPCQIGGEYTTCEHFVHEVAEKKQAKEKTSIKKETKSLINWSGSAFTLEELPLISSRTSPVLIGVVGKAAAGKTSFLAMVYTLLLNGKKLKDYDFAGSKTILGWDELHHRLKLQKGKVPFPAPTPVSSNSLYHLGLRNSDDKLKDVLFTDASGEVFTSWSVNRDDENAGSARWIYTHSSAFMLFIDCEALITDKNLAKREILNIAHQLTHDLKNRPVIAVWSKSDKKQDILPNIQDSLKRELAAIFKNFTEIEISNFLEPGPDKLVTENNLEAITWVLEKVMQPSNSDLTIDTVNSEDLFINYKGK